MQTGLIERVVRALGLDDGYARGKHTPAEAKPLVKDEDGVAESKGIGYLQQCYWDETLPFRAHLTRHYL